MNEIHTVTFQGTGEPPPCVVHAPEGMYGTVVVQ